MKTSACLTERFLMGLKELNQTNKDSLHAGKYCMHFCACFFFLFKIVFQKKSFRNSIRLRVSNSLDQDQARHFVGPDLGPNCLQKLSAEESKAF